MRSVLISMLFILLSGTHIQSAEPTPAEVFEKRILPIFKSPNPSSCVQCHLTGVDLKDYILPDAEKTFRSLRDNKLIDLDQLEQSKIIKLIDMGGNPETGPAAIHTKVRKVERDAFLAWLKVCAADPKLRSAPPLDEKDRAHPNRPDEVIRHSRKDRLLESFEQNVWAWRFRCMNCHAEGSPQNDKLRIEHGDRVAWVKKEDAAATMEYLIASELINIAKPDQSPLLRKPLGEKHGGGLKFVVGDDAYKGFRKWIEDVSSIRGNKYTSAKDLPPTDQILQRFGTDIWFKLEDCPPAWGDQFLQVRLFAWEAKSDSWENTPIAVSDRTVFGKGKLWQHNLTLLAAKESERAKSWRTATPTLPNGKYLVKIYVDKDSKLIKDWKAELGDMEYVGQIEFEAKWRVGYNAMTVLKVRQVK